MARQDKAGLYVDTAALFEVLYVTQFELPKRDRIALVSRMLDHAEKIIGYFELSYRTDEKVKYIDLFIAEFSALKTECRFAIDNMYKSDKTKFRIRELIGRIDDGVGRWRTYESALRQDSRPSGGAVQNKYERCAESPDDL